MPRSTYANAPHLVKSQVQRGRNFFVGHFCKPQSLNLGRLRFINDRLWASFASVAAVVRHHVLHVGFMRVVAQIVGFVVGGVAVFVANLYAASPWAKKSLRNNQMDAFFNRLVVTAKSNRATALAVSGVAQNTANKFARSVGFVWDNTVKASYGSKVGNFIKTNVAGNRFPDFLHDLPLIVKSSVVMVQRQFAQKQIFGSYPSLANQL